MIVIAPNGNIHEAESVRLELPSENWRFPTIVLVTPSHLVKALFMATNHSTDGLKAVLAAIDEKITRTRDLIDLRGMNIPEGVTVL